MDILASDLSKTYDDGKSFALKNVSVKIERGEFIAIIGLSGAGKTTFLRALNGTNGPVAGQLTVLGKSVVGLQEKDWPQIRKEIGFIFQQFNLIKNLSVQKNVLLGRLAYMPPWRALSGYFSVSDRELAQGALSAVGLVGKEKEPVRNLSGGQQQRVGIARALVQNPKIILADEPMASLDPRLSQIILDILARINRERKITVLVNIHVLELAKQYAHRILAFRDGELVFDGKPSALTSTLLDQVYAVGEQGGAP